MSFIVAIDGPAGAGKGTITEEVSKRLHLRIIRRYKNRIWSRKQQRHNIFEW